MPAIGGGGSGSGVNPGGFQRNLPGTGLGGGLRSPIGGDPLDPGGAQRDGNLLLGIAVGAVAALIGAIIWGVVTAATGFQIGFMAIGVGFLVGVGVRIGGGGSGTAFKASGALLAVLGCLAGNLFAGCFGVADYLAQETGEAVSFLDVLLTPAIWPAIMEAMFHPMDILFYLIAIYEGWRFSSVDSE
jgi:hypothetical protein